MIDREKVIVGIEHCDKLGCSMCPYKPGGYSPMDCRIQLMRDALELLKEQEKQKRKLLQNIADNQLANATKDYEFMSLDEHLKNEHKRGIWDGLQMAYEILTEKSVE